MWCIHTCPCCGLSTVSLPACTCFPFPTCCCCDKIPQSVNQPGKVQYTLSLPPSQRREPNRISSPSLETERERCREREREVLHLSSPEADSVHREREGLHLFIVTSLPSINSGPASASAPATARSPPLCHRPATAAPPGPAPAPHTRQPPRIPARGASRPEPGGGGRGGPGPGGWRGLGGCLLSVQRAPWGPLAGLLSVVSLLDMHVE